MNEPWNEFSVFAEMLSIRPDAKNNQTAKTPHCNICGGHH